MPNKIVINLMIVVFLGFMLSGIASARTVIAEDRFPNGAYFKVFFQAAGCGATASCGGTQYAVICKIEKHLNPGERVSYNFKSSQTHRKIIVCPYGEQGNHMGSKVSGHSGTRYICRSGGAGEEFGINIKGSCS